jgi:hypothetical protein
VLLPTIAWNTFPSKNKNAATNKTSIKLARAAKGEIINKSTATVIDIDAVPLN